MKTLADLKRDAKSGKLYGEMTVKNGLTDIPERLRGMRKIIDANTVGVTFLNLDGKKSELPIKCAALCEYSETSLIIFRAGKRPLNAEETAIMNQWKTISETPEYIDRSRIDALTDGSSTYYQQKRFFENGNCPYLMGTETIRGKKRDFATGMIIDNQVRGEIELQYRIAKEA